MGFLEQFLAKRRREREASEAMLARLREHRPLSADTQQRVAAALDDSLETIVVLELPPPEKECSMKGFSLVEVMIALLGLGAASVVVQWVAQLL